MSKGYYEREPKFLNFGANPPYRGIDRSYANVANPYRYPIPHPLPPAPRKPFPEVDRKGYLLRNNARIMYSAAFDFEYDFTDEKTHAEVAIGDDVFVTFNGATKGEFYIETIEGTITNIEPVNNNKLNQFVITVDASSTHESKVYKIGSSAVLDIGRIIEDDMTIQDPTKEVIEVGVENELPPYHRPIPPGLPPIDPWTGRPPHKPHPERCPIEWSVGSIELMVGADNYTELLVPYKKLRPVEVLMVIKDFMGKTVFKCINESKVRSISSSFTWNMVDLDEAVKNKFKDNKVTMYNAYASDPKGEFIFSCKDYKELSGLDDNSWQLNYMVEPGVYTVSLYVCDNFIEFNEDRFNPRNNRNVRWVLNKQITITSAMLGTAIENNFLKDKEEEENGTGGGNTTPETGGNGSGSASTEQPTPGTTDNGTVTEDTGSQSQGTGGETTDNTGGGTEGTGSNTGNDGTGSTDPVTDPDPSTADPDPTTDTTSDTDPSSDSTTDPDPTQDPDPSSNPTTDPTQDPDPANP